MKEPKLEISYKKYSGDSVVTSVCHNKQLLETLDAVAAKTGITRNELISMCPEFSPEHIEIVC